MLRKIQAFAVSVKQTITAPSAMPTNNRSANRSGMTFGRASIAPTFLNWSRTSDWQSFLNLDFWSDESPRFPECLRIPPAIEGYFGTVVGTMALS